MAAHEGQKYGADEPFMTHLDEVVAVLKENGHDSDAVLTAAFLHDTVEDTATSLVGIEARFGADVRKAVEFATDEIPFPGAHRPDKKRATYARVIRAIVAWEKTGGEGTRLGMLVKVADRIANIRHCGKNAGRAEDDRLMNLYRKEREIFRLAYHSDALTECVSMWSEYDRLLRG